MAHTVTHDDAPDPEIPTNLDVVRGTPAQADFFMELGWQLGYNQVITLAAGIGSLPMLMWARQRGGQWGLVTGDSRSDDACTRAARRGHLACMAYAHSEGCPWNAFTSAAAATGGHLACLMYAHEQRCPWHNLTPFQAAAGGHLACLIYAHEHGCPWDRASIIAECTQPHQLECQWYAQQNI